MWAYRVEALAFYVGQFHIDFAQAAAARRRKQEWVVKQHM